MVDVKKLFAMLLKTQRVQNASVTSSVRTGPIYFRKVGKTVWCWSPYDWTNLPHGTYTFVAKIPEGFRPYGTFWTESVNDANHVIGINISHDGDIRAYMYSGSAITSATNGRFSAVWMTD